MFRFKIYKETIRNIEAADHVFDEWIETSRKMEQEDKDYSEKTDAAIDWMIKHNVWSDENCNMWNNDACVESTPHHTTVNGTDEVSTSGEIHFSNYVGAADHS